MKVVFTEIKRDGHEHIIRVNAYDVACHSMLRFLCDEAIKRESDFMVNVKEK